MLAGLDPSTIEFRRVVDMACALVIEVYREYGLKYDEAMEELNKRLAPASPGAAPRRKAPPRQEEEAASMAMLQAMMGASDFRGPRG